MLRYTQTRQAHTTTTTKKSPNIIVWPQRIPAHRTTDVEMNSNALHWLKIENNERNDLGPGMCVCVCVPIFPGQNEGMKKKIITASVHWRFCHLLGNAINAHGYYYRWYDYCVELLRSNTTRTRQRSCEWSRQCASTPFQAVRLAILESLLPVFFLHRFCLDFVSGFDDGRRLFFYFCLCYSVHRN